MDDSSIRTAIDAWLSNPAAAESTYGHISTWETGGVTDMSYLFCGSSSYSSSGCNTAAASFNEDIGAWDTSGVTTMYRMFYYASAFNQDIGWCVDDDMHLGDTFYDTPCESTSCGVIQFADQSDCDVPRTGNVMVNWKIKQAVAAWLSDATAAEATYGHISTWETGGVTDISYLFSKYRNSGAEFFNDDIGAWDTSGVTTMSRMFYEASAFNQDIGSWAVHSVRDMGGIFNSASAFDQDLGWCVDDGVSLRYEMRYAFSGTQCASTSCGVGNMAALWCDGAMSDSNIRTAVSAWLSNPTAAEATYGHISTWNTGRVTDMRVLFSSFSGGWGRDFNEPIGNWDVRNVKNMHNMFEYAESFNQALGKWQVGAVTDMSEMFLRAVSFNQPLNDWDLSNVQKMEEIFQEARAFDQDLGWCVGWDVNLEVAFKRSKCESASCGVAHRDAIGICEWLPSARPCLIATKTQCIINSPTIAIALVVLLAGFGAYVHRRKNKDETYGAAARRLLYSCLCCCCLCCRKKKEPSGVNSQPASPAESPPELGPEEPDEEETRAAAEETTVEESVEPSSFSKKFTSFFFGEREDAPTEEAPKEEEEAAALPVFAEAEEEAPTEQPPPPPARRWFSRAEPEPEHEPELEPEPAAPKAEGTYERMADWYNEPEAE